MKTQIPEPGYGYLRVPEDDSCEIICASCGELHTHPQYACDDPGVPCANCLEKMNLEYFCRACSFEGALTGLQRTCPECHKQTLTANDVYVAGVIKEKANVR